MLLLLLDVFWKDCVVVHWALGLLLDSDAATCTDMFFGAEQFALAETSYILIRLLQEYERIESRDPEPWRENMQITCVGFGGCKVAMTPRS